jgi:hypothetical protein
MAVDSLGRLQLATVEKRENRRKCSLAAIIVRFSLFNELNRLSFIIRAATPPAFRRKMSTETIQMESMTRAFKHWQNLGVGAVLLALNLYLVATASNLISETSTAVQGWAVLIVAGYAFIAAIYLATSTLSDHSPLPQVLPRILDHTKAFVIGAVFYGIGYFLISRAASLPTNQIIAQALALIVGAALVLVAAITAISAALTRLDK